MANFEKLKITGENYIAWITDMESCLQAQGLTDTIKLDNISPDKDKAKAIIFLKKHLDENVMHDYAHLKDPAELWQALEERFDDLKEIAFTHALKDWNNLRFQDFDKVEEYYSTILRIVSQLKFCGLKEDSVLQEICKNRGYKKFSELIVSLLMVEKSNDLLMRMHNSRPMETRTFPEENVSNATGVKIQNEEIKPIGTIVVDSTGHVGDPTTQKTRSLINEFDLNKVPRDKYPKETVSKRKRRRSESQ